MIMICSEETDCALKQLSWAVHRKSKYNLEAYVLTPLTVFGRTF